MPPYKFCLPEEDSSIFTVDPIFGSKPKFSANEQNNHAVSHTKPAHLAKIRTEPQYLLSTNPKELEKAAQSAGMLNPPKETEIYRSATSSGQKEPKQES